MITSPNVMYSKYLMNPDFVGACEAPVWSSDAPFGYDCIDAPTCIAAGSHYSYEAYLLEPVAWLVMPSSAVRGAA